MIKIEQEYTITGELVGFSSDGNMFTLEISSNGTVQEIIVRCPVPEITPHKIYKIACKGQFAVNVELLS